MIVTRDPEVGTRNANRARFNFPVLIEAPGTRVLEKPSNDQSRVPGPAFPQSA